jgi:hypothetical protein
MSATITETSSAPRNAVSSEGQISQTSTLKAIFNYWTLKEPPKDTSELQQIFHGHSSNLQPTKCTVTDVRSLPSSLSTFTLSTHGFHILHHTSSLIPPQSTTLPPLHDESFTKSQYWPELAQMLKSQLSVRSAIALNTTIRDVKESQPGEIDPKNPRARAKNSFQPFFVVHGDYTAPGARSFLRAMLEPEFFERVGSLDSTTASERAEFFQLRREIIEKEESAIREEGVSDQWEWSGKNYRGPRWGILSVWRALETVQADPLGVMDARSFLRADVEKSYVAMQREYANRPGFIPSFRSENVIARPPVAGKEHKWYYISQQRPEEVYALKLFDSAAVVEGSEDAMMVAHSAFRLPGQEDGAMRRSCEVRFLVIW